MSTGNAPAVKAATLKRESKSAAKKKRKARVGLSLKEEDLLRVRLRGNPTLHGFNGKAGSACSEPWVDAQFGNGDDVNADGEEISYRYHIPTAFPPRELRQPAGTTNMVICRLCGRYTPRHCVTARHEICDDCRSDGETKVQAEMREAGILPPLSHGSVKVECRRAGTMKPHAGHSRS